MKVESTAPHVFRMIVPEVKLIPGINIIDNADAEAFLAHPHVKERIAKGLIKVLDYVADESVKDYKALMKDIPGIYDLKLLEKIKAEDKRPSIIKAVDAQLAKLREGRTKDDVEEKE